MVKAFSHGSFRDETWILHFEPQTKRRSLELHRSSSSWKKMFEATLSARKVMVNLFWDAEGIIWSTLCDVVKPSIHICNSNS
jgi:hypothetical protein